MKNFDKIVAALLVASLTPWAASARTVAGEGAVVAHSALPDSQAGLVRVAQLADSESLAEYYRVVLEGAPVPSRPDVSATSQAIRAEAARADREKRTLRDKLIFIGANR